MEAEQEFADFVAARWSTLFRLAYLLSGSHTAAEDLLQSTLEKTYCHWDRVRDVQAPEAYVRKVMTNAAISRRRSLARRREVLADDVPERWEPGADHGLAEHDLVWPLVCALPPRQRAVVVLRFYEDLSEADTADVMGCSVGTVKSQAHDAMRALRRGLAAVSAVSEESRAVNGA